MRSIRRVCMRNVSRTMQITLETYGGRKWNFHLCDSDDFPSVLHGHMCAEGLVLDGETGVIYDKATRKPTGKLKGKELRRLHKEIQTFAQKRIEWYRKEYPYKNRTTSFCMRAAMTRSMWMEKKSIPDTFVFIEMN